MSWVDVEAGARHEIAIAPAKAVAVLKGGVACNEVRARVRYSEIAPMGVVEEFVIRCVLEINTVSAEKIAMLLGFPDASFVEPVLDNCRSAGLLGDDWVQDAHWLHCLRESWESGRVPRTVTRTVDAWFDPLSVQLSPPQETPLALMRAGEKLPELASSSGTDPEWRRYLADSGELGVGSKILDLQIELVSEGLRELEVIVSMSDADSQWTWEPFDPNSGEIVPALFDVCMNNGADEAAQAAMEKYAGAQVVEVEAPTRKVAETLHQLASVAASARVKTYNAMDARREFIAAIAAAQSEVILDYPWINSEAVNVQLLAEMQKAVDRGVRIYIVWGIAREQNQEKSDPYTIADLERIVSNNCTGAVSVIWGGLSHAKQALFDGARLFGGGHNLLSFKPKPERGTVRLETTYDFGGDLHAHLYADFREKFRQRVDNQLRQRAQTSSRDMGLYLALSGDSAALGAMLDVLPRGSAALDSLEWIANAVVDRPQIFSDADRKRVAKIFDDVGRQSGITLAGLPNLRRTLGRLKG